MKNKALLPRAGQGLPSLPLLSKTLSSSKSIVEAWGFSLSQFTNRMAPWPPGPQVQALWEHQEGKATVRKSLRSHQPLRGKPLVFSLLSLCLAFSHPAIPGLKSGFLMVSNITKSAPNAECVHLLKTTSTLPKVSSTSNPPVPTSEIQACSARASLCATGR